MKRSIVAVVAFAALGLSACGKEGTVTEAPEVEGAQSQPTEDTPDEPTEPDEPDVEAPDVEDPTAEDPDLDEPDQEGLDDTDLGDFGDPVAAKEADVSFGDTAAWDDGLEISVASPEEFEPSETAVGAEDYDAAVSVEVTVTNGTDETFSTLFLLMDAESDGSAGEQIFDYGGGLDFSFEDVEPGDDITFMAGFGVDDAGDVQIVVGPDFQYDDVTFSQ